MTAREGTPPKTVAFYLPQFHPVPENDEWWGPGFTEWRNVVQARPFFKGHYQPHLPADLGFYDLRVPETRQAQADLARAHGVDAFCYYHYWFNGKRLLERPFAEVLGSGQPDFPFMLCWANENWTRRWDGLDREILLQQRYGHHDDREHARWLCTAFADERYVRVGGRPVFLVYRVSELPDPRRTTDIWRDEVTSAGLPEPLLCRVEAHEASNDRPDPRSEGFDCAVEFAPDGGYVGPRIDHGTVGRAVRRLVRSSSAYRSHNVFEYSDMVENSVVRPLPEYPLFRCVTPGWDNSARRKQGATIFRNSTPELYEGWLSRIVAQHVDPAPGANWVFVNAWNEWAEGNHLEPDLRWGRAYLEAHARALGLPPQRPV